MLVTSFEYLCPRWLCKEMVDVGFNSNFQFSSNPLLVRCSCLQDDSVQIDKRRNIIVFVDSLFNMLNELNGQFEGLNLSLIRIFQKSSI